jgi:hypothetical protein
VYGSPRAITNVSGTPSLLVPLLGLPPQVRARLFERLLLRGDRAAPGSRGAPYMADGRAT